MVVGCSLINFKPKFRPPIMLKLKLVWSWPSDALHNQPFSVAFMGMLTYQELISKSESGYEALFTAEFYLRIYRGVKTDTVAQLALWALPLFTWFPFVHTGNVYNTMRSNPFHPLLLSHPLSLPSLPSY